MTAFKSDKLGEPTTAVGATKVDRRKVVGASAATATALGFIGAPNLVRSVGAQDDDPPGVAIVEDGARKEELRELIELAKEEGTVAYWDSIVTEQTFNELDSGFKAYWGLPDDFGVTFASHTTSGFTSKASEEIEAEQVSFDVGGVASIVWLYDLMQRGEILEYHSPEVYEAYSRIVDLNLGVQDHFVSNVFYFIPMWNPEIIDKDIQHWEDLADDDFQGQMSMGDVSNSESYLMVHFGLKEIMPESFFQDIASLDPSFKVKSQDLAQDMVTGERPICFSGMPTRAMQISEQGFDLEFVFPEEGVVFIPQSFFMPTRAPHPNAAKLFFEYFLSEEGQQVHVLGEAVSSGRSNFVSPVPKFAPSIDELNAIPIDWSTVTVEEFLETRAEWDAIFKNQ